MSNNCKGCAHLAVSWDKAMPYACNKFGFKSKKSPWLVVIESSGQACQYYTKKTNLRGFFGKLGSK